MAAGSASESERDEADEADEAFDSGAVVGVVELAGGKRSVCPLTLLRSLTGTSYAAARQHLFRLRRRYGLEFEHVRFTRAGRPRVVCDLPTAAKLAFLARCTASTETRLRFVASLAGELGESAHDDSASLAQLREAHLSQVAAMRDAHDALRARVDRLECQLDSLSGLLTS